MPDIDPFPSPASTDLVVDRLEVRRLWLPVTESLDAGHGPTTGTHRELTVVALHGDNGVIGWGECAALATAGYWHETASSAFDALAGLIHRLPGSRACDLIDPRAVAGLDAARLPMTGAAVEMAALDLLLTSENRSLGEWLGVSRSLVPAGAAVGLGPASVVAERVAELADEGYRRVKVKIEPDTAATVLAAVTGRLAARFDVDAEERVRGFEVHVDANGGYSDGSGRDVPDAGVLEALVGLARLGVDVIEQPFATDDEGAAAALRSALIDADLTTLVMADEAAPSVASARHVFALGAADGVVVKPSRLGGLDAARNAVAALAADGAAVSVGGMVESALGRHSLAAVAALDGVSVTGDVSPAGRWLRDDPWPDLETVVIGEALHVVVPTSPGVAPPPDPARIARHTVEQVAAER